MATHDFSHACFDSVIDIQQPLAALATRTLSAEVEGSFLPADRVCRSA